MFCRNCGFRLPDEAKFCLSCGERTPVQEGVKCPSCSAQLPAGARFCRECGGAVEAAAPQAAQPAPFDEDAPTMLLGKAAQPVQQPVSVPAAQPVQPVQQSDTAAAPDLQGMKLPSFLGTGGVPAPRPPAQPAPAPEKPLKARRRRKKGGAVLAVFIVLLLLAAAAAAAYFVMFSDTARISKLTEQAELCLDKKDYDGAVQAYSECVSIGTTDPEIHLALADAYLDDGDPESALEALRRGYEMTSDPEIWARLTELEDDMYEEAEKNDGLEE